MYRGLTIIYLRWTLYFCNWTLHVLSCNCNSITEFFNVFLFFSWLWLFSRMKPSGLQKASQLFTFCLFIFLLHHRWSKVQPVPPLGDYNSTFEEVDNFYSFWWVTSSSFNTGVDRHKNRLHVSQYPNQVAQQPGACLSFCSMKQRGIILLSPGWDAGPLQGYPQH